MIGRRRLGCCVSTTKIMCSMDQMLVYTLPSDIFFLGGSPLLSSRCQGLISWMCFPDRCLGFFWSVFFIYLNVSKVLPRVFFLCVWVCCILHVLLNEVICSSDAYSRKNNLEGGSDENMGNFKLYAVIKLYSYLSPHF